MKKSLIALAALAATASFAQSTVQIDGIADAGFQSINYKGNTVNGIAGNGSSTSQLNFRGSEDLGGGLKAEFRVETDWNMVSNYANTGTASGTNFTSTANSINSSAGTFGNGEIRVGLAGGFGRVDLGAVNYNTLGTFLLGQPFGTAIGSGFRGVFVNDAQTVSSVRAENAIKYTTPTFSGFNATLYKSNKQTKAGTGIATDTNFSTTLGAYDQQGAEEIGLNYANGPIAASFSSLKNDFSGVGTGTATQTVNTAAGKYTFNNGLAISLLNQSNKKDDNSLNNKTFTISGTYTMGAVVLMAQFGELKNISDVKTKMWALGADYNLSKRTAVYARYESIDDQAHVIATAATIDGSETKRTRTAIGLRHAF